MEAEARYTWVGAAVLALLAALVLSIVWLRNVGGAADISRYTIYFERQSLDGLEVGAEVTLRGIKIGRVEDYALADEKLSRVRVEVRIDKRAPLRTNTTAVVTRNFVTGIARIELSTGQPPGELLTAVANGERYPVLGEGRSDFDDLSGRVNKVGDMAAVTIDSLNQLLSADNREAAMATLRNLRDLSAGLNQRLGALDKTLDQVGAAANEVGSAAGRLGRAGDRALVVAEQVGGRLDSTLAETERALDDARQAMTKVAAAGVSVEQQATASAQRLQDTAANVDYQLEAAVAELRLSIETASRVLDGLRDPRAALLGPAKGQLGPGERLP
jgi:phospholipid/cholesterol/gamma-HCH transport system substrate-binding protein